MRGTIMAAVSTGKRTPVPVVFPPPPRLRRGPAEALRAKVGLRPVTIRAHAKINLDLRVVGTRPDGFHELRTVFQAISLHDTIDCIPREGPFSIACEAAGVPLDRSNLVWQAAEALWRSLRRSGPVRDVMIRLEKRIPLQAGLG
ncbi:MAG: 4-(cytidine 5'-diphospho)-2-C-methyl-D-erythritol kinase, partial [Vicinamibacterales bacterium]